MAIYQTGFGNAYEFSFEKQADGSYRAYIVVQPSYGIRDTSLHATHRLTDRSRHYVCREPQPKNYESAKQTAAKWATLSDRYIITGQPFPKS